MDEAAKKIIMEELAKDAAKHGMTPEDYREFLLKYFPLEFSEKGKKNALRVLGNTEKSGSGPGLSGNDQTN